jgi:hypothetical protein
LSRCLAVLAFASCVQSSTTLVRRLSQRRGERVCVNMRGVSFKLCAVPNSQQACGAFNHAVVIVAVGLVVGGLAWLAATAAAGLLRVGMAAPTAWQCGCAVLFVWPVGRGSAAVVVWDRPCVLASLWLVLYAFPGRVVVGRDDGRAFWCFPVMCWRASLLRL